MGILLNDKLFIFNEPSKFKFPHGNLNPFFISLNNQISTKEQSGEELRV